MLLQNEVFLTWANVLLIKLTKILEEVSVTDGISSCHYTFYYFFHKDLPMFEVLSALLKHYLLAGILV